MQTLPESTTAVSFPLPKNILLATDLSCRCDRALDRSIACAKSWGAHLTALTVVDKAAIDGIQVNGSHAEDPAMRAAKRLRKDTRSTDRTPAVIVRTGEVVDELLDVSTGGGMDLIVTGVARNQWLRTITLGGVVDGILRNSTVPTLVVRNRVSGDYRKVAVAGDFSPKTERLMAAALGLFPDAEITFFHVFNVPFLGLSDGNREAVCEQARRDATRDAKEFLASIGMNRGGAPFIRIECEMGPAVTALSEHARRHDIDLVIIGNRGHGVVAEMLMGSLSKEILQNIESDVLVIPVADGGTGADA